MWAASRPAPVDGTAALTQETAGHIERELCDARREDKGGMSAPVQRCVAKGGSCRTRCTRIACGSTGGSVDDGGERATGAVACCEPGGLLFVALLGAKR